MSPPQHHDSYYRIRRLLRHSGYRCTWQAAVGQYVLSGWISRSRRGALILQKNHDGEITLYAQCGVPTEWDALESWLVAD